MDELVEKAKEIAARAHRGQVDKAGKPYFGHPARVAASLESPEEKIVGYLHDVVEDTEVELDDLVREGFPPEIVAAVDAVTRRDGEDREDYYVRVLANRTALVVKIADMTDNMDESRIEAPTEKDKKRMERYRKTLPRLEAALADMG